MRNLLRVQLRPVNNDRGNAVAIVLMVLAIVSLLGVGLLTQSRIDMKFVSSFKSHNTVFNLADGAAGMALTRLSFTVAPMYDGNPASTLLNAAYTNPQPVTTSGAPAGPTLSDRGNYWPVMIFRGPITDPSKLAGREIGRDGFSLECWTAQGSGLRRDTSIANSGVATSNTEIRQGRHLPTATSVQIAVYKWVPM